MKGELAPPLTRRGGGGTLTLDILQFGYQWWCCFSPEQNYWTETIVQLVAQVLGSSPIAKCRALEEVA